MNRKDIAIVAVLVALLLAWPVIDRFIARRFFPSPPPAPIQPTEMPATETALAPSPATSPEAPPPAARETAAAAAPESPAPMEEPPAAGEERRFILRNGRAEYTFSSRGASLVEVRLLEYRQTNSRDSGPAQFDFSAAPALEWRGVPGADARHDFEGELSEDGRRLRFERRTPAGLRYVRQIELDDAFSLRIHDAWINEGNAPLAIERPRLTSGAMRNLPGETLVGGQTFLGIDTLSPGGERVKHWGREFIRMFERDQKASELARPRPELRPALPDTGRPVEWVAVKNKYFVQILRPEGGADAADALLRRNVTERERLDPAHRPRVEIAEVSAELRFQGRTLEPGTDARRELEVYFGPKKYAELRRLKFHQADVMEFRRMPAIAILLLNTLNGLYALAPNYGVAIILLTIVIRIVFWPITRKSAQSMRRLQEIQPLVNEIRARYKDNPQRQQKEIMALYKEHKVNPIGGCLPLLIQIPVFIALFDVLGAAIELRFARFLWVRDLSEPENLFAGMIPFIGSLNLLPLIMTATQIWQQKLTPQTGDASQQKMMMFMPVIMLVFFYHFASGLVLYWTTSQVLMIISQLYQRRQLAKGRPASSPTPAKGSA